MGSGAGLQNCGGRPRRPRRFRAPRRFAGQRVRRRDPCISRLLGRANATEVLASQMSAAASASCAAPAGASRPPSSSSGAGAGAAVAATSASAGSGEAAGEGDCDAALVAAAKWPPAGTEDFAGVLRRKVPRLRAVTSTWETEWCVASHNFLLFFASRTNLRLKRGLLLSGVLSAKAEPDGYSLRVRLVEEPDLLLQVPDPSVHGSSAALVGTASWETEVETRRREAQRWIEEVNRRAQLLRSSGARLVPCITLPAAGSAVELLRRDLLKDVDADAQAAHAKALQIRGRTGLVRLLGVLRTSLLQATRDAFEELAFHTRLHAARDLQRRAAVQRLFAALGRPWERQARTALGEWYIRNGPVLGARLRAQERLKRRQAGFVAGTLSTLFAERSRADVSEAFHRLACHTVKGVDDALSEDDAAAADLRDAAVGESPPLVSVKQPVFAFDPPPRVPVLKYALLPVSKGVAPLRPRKYLATRRQNAGLQMLHIAIGNMCRLRYAWAIGTWAFAVAHGVQVDADAVAQDAEVLNAELRARLLQDTRARALAKFRRVLSAATSRRTEYALVTLALVGRARARA
eukprot:TRINITY_DN19007_c0_g1_i1.p2 TRINITY_DN19007_c0_g1~~TRINITY_DN19007_c0_g1_i1.p2  ORF type:complete len:600 (-),score=119.98 TRINITY_DN19007_c0_g1_i1:204-1934(-)